MMQMLQTMAPIADLRLTIEDRLRLACDTDQLRDMMTAGLPPFCADRKIVSLALERLHPRSDGSFIVSYDVVFDGDEDNAAHRLFGVLPIDDPYSSYLTTIGRLEKDRRGQLSKSNGDQFIGYLEPIGMTLRFCGLDEKIDGLKYYRRPRLLADITGSEQWLPEGAWLNVQLLAHRLNRRAVIRARVKKDPDQVWMLKFYKNGSDRAQKAFDVMRFLRRTSFAPGSAIRVPTPLQILENGAGMAMEHVAGKPIEDLQQADHLNAMILAGDALGRLHRLPLRMPRSFEHNDEVTLLENWIRLSAVAWPQYAKQFEDRFRDISNRLALVQNDHQVLLHRDFHEGQILVSGDTGHLIDFDTLSNGDAAVDLGNFIAHLQFRQLQGNCDANACIGKFLTDYERSAERGVPEHMDVYRASTALRLATIYSFSSYWKHLVPDLLELSA